MALQQPHQSESVTFGQTGRPSASGLGGHARHVWVRRSTKAQLEHSAAFKSALAATRASFAPRSALRRADSAEGTSKTSGGISFMPSRTS
jgi:hypothetical protein